MFLQVIFISRSLVSHSDKMAIQRMAALLGGHFNSNKSCQSCIRSALCTDALVMTNNIQSCTSVSLFNLVDTGNGFPLCDTPPKTLPMTLFIQVFKKSCYISVLPLENRHEIALYRSASQFIFFERCLESRKSLLSSAMAMGF